MIDHEELLAKMIELIPEVRGCDEEEVVRVVTLDTTVTAVSEGLGLESIDYLELGYRLQEFGIKLDIDALGEYYSTKGDHNLTVREMFERFASELPPQG